MSEFQKTIDRFPGADRTLEEVLETVQFQNSATNKLVDFDVQTNKVVLTFAG